MTARADVSLHQMIFCFVLAVILEAWKKGKMYEKSKCRKKERSDERELDRNCFYYSGDYIIICFFIYSIYYDSRIQFYQL